MNVLPNYCPSTTPVGDPPFGPFGQPWWLQPPQQFYQSTPTAEQAERIAKALERIADALERPKHGGLR